MKKLIKMPKISYFNNFIQTIIHTTRYEGVDENDKPIYNNNPLPILSAKGTVKLHGTNAAVCYNVENGLWAQSKNNIITPKKDNAGFAFFVEKNKNSFLKLIESINFFNSANLDKETIAIYGEWAGTGIQSGVGISKLEKKFYLFGVKIVPDNSEIAAYWLPNITSFISDNPNILNISSFQTFQINVDFNMPAPANREMLKMLAEVEKECPVAKAQGISGIGEGIVFETIYKNDLLRWKIKGEKHAGIPKIKKSQKIDDQTMQQIIDTAEKVTPEWRLSQMYQETFNTLNGGKGDIKKTGDYLRAVIQDIMAEDMNIIIDSGLTPKQVNPKISDRARKWFMIKLNEEAGL